jgi:hypothetical protein
MITNTFIDKEKNMDIEPLISKDSSYFEFYIGSQITSLYATKCLFFEITLLPYRTRFYDNINFQIIHKLLRKANINSLIQPLYIHKPTIFFHSIYTKNSKLIKLMLQYNPEHYIEGQYSLLTAIKTKDISTIKTLIPYTNIHFQIDNTTPYKYVISNFQKTHPIYMLFEYVNLYKYSLLLLIKKTNISIDIISKIKEFIYS